MRGINKEMRKLVQAAEGQSWRVELTNGGHLKFLPPEGPFIIAAQTPSDRRTWLNTRANLRRAGLVI